jgi:putative CocE/NonD family hydrolase
MSSFRQNAAPSRRLFLLFCAVLLVLPALLQAQTKPDNPPAYDVKAHYTKYEFRIPMRDGVKLFTAVYVPKDASHAYPFLINRTPYGVDPYGPDRYRKSLGPSESFERDGFIFVFQDARGRFLSEGDFIEVTPHKENKKSAKDVDESTDCYDTIEWLLHNVPNNNGKAGIYGISYDGFYTAASIINSHPALKAASPQAPVADLYMGDDAYHNGAFMLEANFGFYAIFKPRTEIAPAPEQWPHFDYGTTDGYDFYLQAGTLANLRSRYLKDFGVYWDDQIKHSNYDDWWKARNISAFMKNVHCAVLAVGGWFDAEDLVGPGKVFQAVAKFNPDTPDTLVMGPWVHGGWAHTEGDHLGDVNFAGKHSPFFNDNVLLPFFRQYLKGEGNANLPRALMFETGTNVWRRYDSWPPKNTEPRSLYLHSSGQLSFDPPTESTASFDEYVSDPAHPVPFVNFPALGVPQTYMDADQRFAAKRPDVLVYQTAPLEDDITVSGAVAPHLWVSTSGTDSDYVVKLIDVYPEDFPNPDANSKEVQMGGYEQLVRGEPFRGKFRNTFERPEPFVPGQPTVLNFSLPDINHTFRRGHRIMVQIQSSWFPLVDRNPQKFLNIPEATEADFQKATERVYHSKSNASALVLPVLH